MSSRGKTVVYLLSLCVVLAASLTFADDYTYYSGNTCQGADAAWESDNLLLQNFYPCAWMNYDSGGGEVVYAPARQVSEDVTDLYAYISYIDNLETENVWCRLYSADTYFTYWTYQQLTSSGQSTTQQYFNLHLSTVYDFGPYSVRCQVPESYCSERT